MSELPRNGQSGLGNAEDDSGTIQSMPFHGMGELDSEHGVVLKDWSAQQFANIYVRFHPHLLSHARKFLRDESQSEEVVQDAFLYLMTALPELDSELGVLRFLKWKTKMLSLDIIRSSKSWGDRPLDSLTEISSEESEPQLSLERADDAALVRLALAKLSTRQREVLVATLYEEKSQEEVAQQMGLDPNALRQLLYRARKAFRLALVGVSNVEGKSVGEILSLAAKKHASAAKLGLSLAILITTASLGLPTNLGGISELNAQRQEIDIVSNEDQNRLADLIPRSGVFQGEESIPAPPLESLGGPSITGGALDNDFLNPEQNSRASGSQNSLPRADANEVSLISSKESLVDSAAREESARNFDSQLMETLSQNSMTVRLLDRSVKVTNEGGLAISFAIDVESEQIVQFVVVELESDGQVWKAVPSNFLVVKETLEDSMRISYAATDFLVGDFSGGYDFVSTDKAEFFRTGIVLEFFVLPDGAVKDASVALRSDKTFLANS